MRFFLYADCISELNLTRWNYEHIPWYPAAVFFSTYDTLKRTLPFSPSYAAVTHMVSASIAEVVRFSLSLSSFRHHHHRRHRRHYSIHTSSNHAPGSLPHPRPHRSREIPRSDVVLRRWRTRQRRACVVDGGEEGIRGGWFEGVL